MQKHHMSVQLIRSMELVRHMPEHKVQVRHKQARSNLNCSIRLFSRTIPRTIHNRLGNCRRSPSHNNRSRNHN